MSLFLFTLFKRTRTLGVVALSCAVLLACSGGVSDVAGGVGSGGSGVAEGAVSGFGSVIVDGLEYDDTNASVVQDNAQGASDPSQAKLGQRVRIIQSATGVAEQIMVLPQLRGSASSAADSDGWFQLLDQWVHIIATNDTQNTSTVLDGLSTVASGDPLEVHGTWTFDSGKNVSVLVATRIEKLSAAPEPVTMSGVVRSRTGNTLVLDSIHGTVLSYAHIPAGVGAQSLVTAWLPSSALSSTPWQVTRLVDASPQPTGNAHLLLGTQITAQDVSNGQVMVQGLPVKLPSEWRNTPPALGSSVQMDIVRDGQGWKAVTVTQRQSSTDLGGAIHLKGSVTWPAQPASLTLREVTVNVPPPALSPSCASLRAGDVVYLEIVAQRMAPDQPPRATQVLCPAQQPANAVIETAGSITQIDRAASTLVLSTAQGSMTFKWTTLTRMPPNFDDTWLNSSVVVEYQIVNGENRLRKLKPN